MPSKFETVITDQTEYGTVMITQGAAIIADCVLNGRKLPIVEAAAGDGGGEATTPTPGQTALVNERWRGEIAGKSLSPTTPNMIDVKVVIEDSVGGFTIREMGLYSDTGVLIAVCNTPATEKVAISSGVYGKLAMIMHIVVADVSVLEFKITPSLDMVNRQELDEAVDALALAKQDALSGTPGQVVGFNEDGKAEAVRGWSNPGLIINGDFRRPVNRNGKDEYVGVVYGIDCWRGSAPAAIVRVSADGVRLTHTATGVVALIEQSFDGVPIAAGESVTFSLLYDELEATDPAALLSLQIIINGIGYNSPFVSAPEGLLTATATPGAGGTLEKILIIKRGASGIISVRPIACKLEPGLTQTLAHQDGNGSWVLNDPPDYALQYALCSLYSPHTGAWVGNRRGGAQLLDNAYWGDREAVVNQRRKTEYTGTGYCIDRWKATATGTVVTLVDNGLRLTAPADKNVYLLQYFERPLSPGEYTLSTLVSEAEGTGYLQFIYQDGTYGPAVKITGSGLFVIAAVATKEVGRVALQTNAGGSIIFEAAKLEPGLTQTLAHQDGDGNWVLNDPPPNRALELEKCQKYAIAMDGAEVRASRVTANAVRAFFPTPHSLRANPAITKGAFQVKSLSSGNMMTNAKWTVMAFETGILITATLEGHGQSDCTIFSNGVFLSSDL